MLVCLFKEVSMKTYVTCVSLNNLIVVFIVDFWELEFYSFVKVLYSQSVTLAPKRVTCGDV